MSRKHRPGREAWVCYRSVYGHRKYEIGDLCECHGEPVSASGPGFSCGVRKRASMRELHSVMTPEQRSDRTRKAMAARSEESKSEAGRRAGTASQASRTPEERSAFARKGAIARNSNLTPEERIAQGKRGFEGQIRAAIQKTGISHPYVALSEYRRRLWHERVMALAQTKAESMYERSAE